MPFIDDATMADCHIELRCVHIADTDPRHACYSAQVNLVQRMRHIKPKERRRMPPKTNNGAPAHHEESYAIIVGGPWPEMPEKDLRESGLQTQNEELIFIGEECFVRISLLDFAGEWFVVLIDNVSSTFEIQISNQCQIEVLNSRVPAFSLARRNRSLHGRYDHDRRLLETLRLIGLCLIGDLQTAVMFYPMLIFLSHLGDSRMKLTRIVSLPWRIFFYLKWVDIFAAWGMHGLPSGGAGTAEASECWVAWVGVDVKG